MNETRENPKGISVVCTRCRRPILPNDLPSAEQRRIERTDGGYNLQYDHGGECPADRARAMNSAHPQTAFVGGR